MKNDIQFYAAMAEATAKQITKNNDTWTAFLETAARLYKYPYPDQLMIYAQRPEATACADVDVWNVQMKRYIRSNSKEIALLDYSGESPKIKLVFDVSDTGGDENSKLPYLWEYNSEYESEISSALEKRYKVSGDFGIVSQLEFIVFNKIFDFWDGNQNYISDIVDNSLLYGYDEENLRDRFVQTAMGSALYAILSRCGLEPAEDIQNQYLSKIYEFNTAETVTVLGTAINYVTEEILREIEKTVKSLDKERSKGHGHNQLYQTRGLSDAADKSEKVREEISGQIRNNEARVSEGASPDTLEHPHIIGETVRSPVRNRRNSKQKIGADVTRIDESDRRNGNFESRKSDDVDWSDEQLPFTSRGDNTEGTDLQLTLFGMPYDGEQLTLFPSETEQKEKIKEAESVEKTLFAFPLKSPISQDVIDEALRIGNSKTDSTVIICSHFMKNKTVKEDAEFLKSHFRDFAAGFYHNNNKYSLFCNNTGICISEGETALGEFGKTIIWEQAAERIRELLQNGEYISQTDIEKAENYEITDLSHKLWYLRQDFSDEAKERNLFPTVAALYKNNAGFPNGTAAIIEALNDNNKLSEIISELQEFISIYEKDSSILRFHFHKPKDFLERLKDLQKEQLTFSADKEFNPTHKFFISQDEIDKRLMGNSADNFLHRLSVFSIFKNLSDKKERVQALKNVSSLYSTKKGIHISRGNSEITPVAEVELSWSMIYKRISELIDKDKFFTEQDKAKIAGFERKDLAIEIVDFLINAPLGFAPDFFGKSLYECSDKLEEITQNLKVREKTVELFQNVLQPIWNTAKPDMPHYESMAKCIDNVKSYIEGKFSILIKDTLVESLPEIKTEISESAKEKNKLSFYDEYNELKEHNPDDIILYQVGDFFELYGDDAVLISKEIDLILTSRKVEGAGRVDMCGFPTHVLETYIKKIRQNHNVTLSAVPNGEKERKTFRFLSFHQEPEITAENEETVDDFLDIDVEEIREKLKKSGFVNGKVVDEEALNNDPFIQQVVRDAERIAAEEKNTPVSVEKTEIAYQVGDDVDYLTYQNDLVRFHITDIDNDYVYYTFPDLPEQAPVSMFRDEFETLLKNKSAKVVEHENLPEAEIDYENIFFTNHEYDIFQWIKRNNVSETETSYSVYAVPYDLIVEAKNNSNSADEFFKYIESSVEEMTAKQGTQEHEIYTEVFESGAGDCFNLTHETMEELFSYSQKMLRYDEKERDASISSDENNAAERETSAPKADSIKVTVPYAEHPAFDNVSKGMSFALANKLYGFTDEKQHRERIEKEYIGWYHKSDFLIEAVINGEEFTYDGSYDIGDGDGGLLEHIKAYYKYCISPKCIYHASWRAEGEEFYKEQISNAHWGLDVFVPFLERHLEMTPEEEIIYAEIIADEDKWFVPRDDFTEQQDYESEATDDVETDNEERLPYNIGDCVFIDDKEYKITDLSDTTVKLLDTTHRIPYHRTEDRRKFELFLHNDTRNGHITEFLPANLDISHEGLKEVLVKPNGLFDSRDKNVLSTQFLNGFSNTKVAQYLDRYAGTTNSVELSSGETVDYLATTVGVEITYRNDPEIKFFHRWNEISPVLRAFYEQEMNGFSKEPVFVIPEGFVQVTDIPKYEVGDTVTLPYPDKEITGTIGYIGDTNVRIDTAPYSWSNEVVNKEHFEEKLRQSEKNAHLFTTGNFRITDEHLGEGGAKTKFRWNVDAIKLLKELEFEGRKATPEEQEILSKYVGWGGLADVFDESKEKWADEFTELYELLSPEEYKAARASVSNAHYTSPTVIKAVYEALGNMGFKKGNILEPAMGIGNFFGMIPDEMSESKLYGIEVDSISGRISKQLYPQADITIAGFETTDRKDFFDVAIGNVPFGKHQVNDRAFNKLGFSIHNYFFAKALEQVRPGGVVAFITSRHTLDSENPEVRKYLAKRADLLGAIRLPNTAFKANAGTDVVSDIIFLQKRDRPNEIEPNWVNLAVNNDGYSVNSYFVEHPEMIAGVESEESTRHGMDYTVEPNKDISLPELLHYAVDNIHGTYQEAEISDIEDLSDTRKTLPADPNVKNYSFTVVDGEVYYRENSIMVQPEINDTAKERIKGMVSLRDCVNELIAIQLDEFATDKEVEDKQKELNTLYDKFSKKFGLINSRGNSIAFSKDSSYYLLCSLEVLDKDRNFERKADMFTKRTVSKRKQVTHADTAVEALAVSIGEKACVDLGFMASLMGGSENIPKIVEDLRGVIFKDPSSGDFDLESGGTDWYKGWQTADEYLSGNVRKKLLQAKRAAEKNPDFSVNVEALEKVQPIDLEASEIEVRLGTTWIDTEYFEQFMYETFKTPSDLKDKIKVEFSSATGEWFITNKTQIDGDNVAAYMTYGTEDISAYRILENALNLRETRIYDVVYDADGKEKRVLNLEATTLAAQKQQLIRDEFKDWIWKDADRRHILVKQYNEEMNCIRPREFDGSHITFEGMNPTIQLRKHQIDAVARILYGQNTLLAHEVGAGKTFTMIAGGMELKKIGLCNKSMYVVPNHLIDQWATDFLTLYPSANIFVASKKDFEPKNRKKFISRIATGDYDAVILGFTQFERVPISYERQKMLLEVEIENITDAIRMAGSEEGKRFTVKQMESTKKSLEARLEKLAADHKKDDVICFEQLGIDRLFVDESDNYKNLFLHTKMSNVAGLSTTSSQKSTDMYMKCRYLDEVTGGVGITFATGTPISNSMTEMFTIQRYLQYDLLQEMGMSHFDSWASRFGETTTALELAPEGSGYRSRTRFAKFFNLPELINMFKEVADIKTAVQLNLPTPEVEYHTEVSAPTETQKEMMQLLSERASKIHSGVVKSHEDNMLKVTNDGRKLGLDQRVIDSSLPDEEGTKVNKCVDNVFEIWQQGKEEKLTQLVFCDLSTPKKGSDKEFSIYDDIRGKLIEKGMPPEQIAFIHDAETEKQKQALFGKVRNGDVRVLIGSTSKMGAGTNVQDRLYSSHDLDCPWRPRDLTQRAGRIIRQGNMNKKVHIYRYVAENTFDAYLWQTVEKKQSFIAQIWTSKSPARTCEDIDATELSFAEIKSLCAGDPRIKEKMDLDIQVSKLKLLKREHNNKQFKLEDDLTKYFPKAIEQHKADIKGFEKDIETFSKHPLPGEGFVGIEIQGEVYSDKEKAGEELLETVKRFKDRKEPVKIGTYRGLNIYCSRPQGFDTSVYFALEGEKTYKVKLGTDPKGNFLRMDNVLNKIADLKKETEVKLNDLYNQQAEAKAEIGKAFPHDKELTEKSARLAELDTLLTLIDRGEASADKLSDKASKSSIKDRLNKAKSTINATKQPTNKSKKRTEAII